MGVSWGGVGTSWGALGASYECKYENTCADATQNMRTRALLGSRSVYTCADATQNTRTRALSGSIRFNATWIRAPEKLSKGLANGLVLIYDF